MIPPIGPTTPAGSMVPVVATCNPPVNSPGVIRSKIDSVRARPAEFPPTLPVLTLTSIGRSSTSSQRVWGTTPMYPIVGSSGRGWRANETTRDCPPSTGSTSKSTISPGLRSRIAMTRSPASRTGIPSTLTITSLIVNLPVDGPSTWTWASPTPVGRNGSMPKYRRATATAVDFDTRISCMLKARFSSRDRPSRIRSSSTRVSDGFIRASNHSQPLTVASWRTVVKWISPVALNRCPVVTITFPLNGCTEPGRNTK